MQSHFFGTGKSFRETESLGITPFSLSLITAREEVVITTHLSLAQFLRWNQRSEICMLIGSLGFARVAVVVVGIERSEAAQMASGIWLAEEALRSDEDRENCFLPLATDIRQELGTAGWCLQCQLLACLVNYLVNWPLKFPTACPLLHSKPAAELFTLFQRGRWISSVSASGRLAERSLS